jgi:hypothetical protein
MGESGREGSGQRATVRGTGRPAFRYRRTLGRPKPQHIVIRQVGTALVVEEPHGGTAAAAGTAMGPSTAAAAGVATGATTGKGIDSGTLERFARLLPADPTTRTLLVPDGVELGRSLERLDPVVDHLRDGERLRLVLGSASVQEDGGSCPASQLATRIGREVLVPDGPVLLHPGGTLYVTHPDGPQWGAGRWLRFHPGSSPVAMGAHYPEPRWIEHTRQTMATAGRIAHGEVLGIPIPAGWMLRRLGASAERPPDDLSFSVPVNDHWCTVLLGCGDELAPDVLQVAGWLENLPPELCARVALGTQGAGPERDACSWPWAVARALGQRVAAWNGVPLADEAGIVRVTICDRAGAPAWCPTVGLLVVSPTGRCDIAAWQYRPGADLPPCAPDPEGCPVAPLPEGWVCEVVPSGLWIRPREVEPSGARRPVLDVLPTAERLTLVVGTTGHRVPSGVWSCLPGLVTSMHPQMRSRLDLVIVGEVSVPGLNAVTAVTDRYKVSCGFREELAEPGHPASA